MDATILLEALVDNGEAHELDDHGSHCWSLWSLCMLDGIIDHSVKPCTWLRCSYALTYCGYLGHVVLISWRSIWWSWFVGVSLLVALIVSLHEAHDMMESLKKPSRTYKWIPLAFDDHMMYGGGAFRHAMDSCLTHKLDEDLVVSSLPC